MITKLAYVQNVVFLNFFSINTMLGLILQGCKHSMCSPDLKGTLMLQNEIAHSEVGHENRVFNEYSSTSQFSR